MTDQQKKLNIILKWMEYITYNEFRSEKTYLIMSQWNSSELKTWDTFTIISTWSYKKKIWALRFIKWEEKDLRKSELLKRF